MIVYEVGTPLPHPTVKPPATDGAKALLIGSFFNVLLYLSEPEGDAELIRKQPLRYGVYQKEDNPFFLLELGRSQLCFEISINTVGIDGQTQYLEGDTNLITLLLLDTRTNRIHALRPFSIKPQVASTIREIGRKQLGRYQTHELADAAIEATLGTVSLRDMFSRSQMHTA